MIIRFDYRNESATIMAFTGNKWTVPLGYHRWTHNNKSCFFDFGTLLMDRKVNPSTLLEDATAARELVDSWEDFEEKPTLLSVIDDYIRKRNEDMSVVFEAALREAYGIVDGALISRGVASGKLSAHKDVLTKKAVVDLVKYLMDKMPMLAIVTFPSPKSAIAAARAAQQHHLKVNKLNEMTKGVDSFQIFTAWRIASFLEKAADRRVAEKLRNRRFTAKVGDMWGYTARA